MMLQHRTPILPVRLITPDHTVHQISQRPIIVLPSRQPVLVDEQDVMLEAGVEVRLQP